MIVPPARKGQFALKGNASVGVLMCGLRGDPCKLLVREREVLVCTVGCEAATVVVQGEDLTLWFHRSGLGGRLIFVNVVTKLFGISWNLLSFQIL